MDYEQSNCIYLARHGQTAFNVENVIRGWLDMPLNDQGFKEAEELADTLLAEFGNRPPRAISTSDMRRTQQTATIVARELEAEVRATAALRPWNLGEFQGVDVNVAHQAIPDFVRHPRKPIPRGESFGDFAARFLNWLQVEMAAIIKRSRAPGVGSNGPRPVLCITHYRNLRLSQAFAVGLDKKLDGQIDIPTFLMDDEWNTGEILRLGWDGKKWGWEMI